MMKLIPRSCRKKNGAVTGFTLIELIMTIVVIGIVAIPLSLLVSQHIESVFYSEDYTSALNLARFELEKVTNLAYANINSASISNYEGYAYDITRTVIFVQGNAGSAESLKKITVDVKKAGDTAILASMVTYAAKNVIYGM